ncbi:MAG: HipA domain-containing protein [Candidatus Thiothrix putei]|uniref:HipA domain-containing protein n=1 Tax=Candidatus Thiothrix putei TaxID=3080811 RepID=A0AA95KQ49_9GAMM|nr:MAG: HipA domain-containing protein [Candidatus Thiothrix putei]
MRTLQVYINTRRIGELRDENGIWSFTYADDWVTAADGYAISPALPLQLLPHLDGSSQRSVQWFFDNLLPEEGARTLLARDARLDLADNFGLLAYYGAESAGSLILRSEQDPITESGERPLSDASLHERIQRLPTVSLSTGAAKRMSLAGAQHKLPVVLRAGQLFEPIGNTPSTHILKPDHPDKTYAHSVINEFFTMRLAKALNIPVPNVTRHYVPEPVYLIERFDRQITTNHVERLHVLDACQLLDVNRQFKYTHASIERLHTLAERCHAPAAARLRLYSWLVFNVLVGNSDAHLKNLSFLMGKHGISLAPHYDLLAIAVYDTKALGRDVWPHTSLAWPLFDKHTFAEIKRATLLEAGAVLGIQMATCERLLDFQLKRIKPAAKQLLLDIEQENRVLLQQHPALAHFFVGESRCLRTIVYLIIHDMVKQLTG